MIVKMSKITILGIDDQRKAVIDSLMDIGAVEISVVDTKEYEHIADHPGVQTELAAIENKIADARAALTSIDHYCPLKKGLFQSRRELTKSEFSRVLEDQDSIRDLISNIRELEEHLVLLKNEENRLNNILISLLPWEEYAVPLEISGTQKTIILPGTIPGSIDLTRVKEELNDKADCSELEVIRSDRDQHYVFAVYHHDAQQECLSCLKAYGFNKASFSGMTGTVSENIGKLQTRIREISTEREKAVEQIKSQSKGREALEAFYDGLGIERAHMEAAGKVLETNRAFLINGWIPTEIASKAKEHLESEYTVSIEIAEPEDEEEFPVLLENMGIAEAGEPVSNMYSLPHSREIDPNAVMAPFFILFFGLMLSDGGYGILMALAAGFILKRFKLEDGTRKFIKLIFYCGIATIFWGILFGSWFGIEALAKYGVWLNPVEKPELLLSWSLLFGIIHMYAGFGLKAANLIRRKKYLDALFDVGFRLIFYTGFIMVLLPFAPEMNKEAAAPLVDIGLVLLIAGAILIVLTQGRDKKNIIGKFFGGVMSLYDVVGFMSDVLSYSRLLALGLATGIIASIINQMSVMFDFPLILKVILMVAILLVGHIVNFAINALGAYVHSCRLQYLEFFGKFFTGGGEAFKPLRANTKYVALKPDVGE